LYAKSATAAEAAQFGLTLEEAQGPSIEVWPDNILSVNVFISMSTQWRTGAAGATGLDYTALEATMRMMGITANGEILEDIRVLEDAALETMRKSQK
jgi:hypothetical protein